MFLSRRNVLKLKNAGYTDPAGMNWKDRQNEWRRGVEGRKGKGTKEELQQYHGRRVEHSVSSSPHGGLFSERAS